MIDFKRFTPELLASEPYRLAFVGELFSPADAADLVNTFPRITSRQSKAATARRGYEYEARSLVMMGANVAIEPYVLDVFTSTRNQGFLSFVTKKSTSRLSLSLT